MELLEMMLHRRSVRQYTGELIPAEKLEMILKAGLTSATSRGRRPWELIVVQDKEVLAKMVNSRTHSAKMLEKAGAAIVVVADTGKLDVWTEDCSIVMANMHLMADALGLGSCWIQGRLRESADGRTTDAYLKDLLGIPEEYALEAFLSVGIPETRPDARTEADLPMEKIHYERF